MLDFLSPCTWDTISFPISKKLEGRDKSGGRKGPSWFSRGWRCVAVGLWGTLTNFPSIYPFAESWGRWYLSSGSFTLAMDLQSDTQTLFLCIFVHPACFNQKHVKSFFSHLPWIWLHVLLGYRLPLLWGVKWGPGPGRTQSSCTILEPDISPVTNEMWWPWWVCVLPLGSGRFSSQHFCFAGIALPAKWRGQYLTSFIES